MIIGVFLYAEKGEIKMTNANENPVNVGTENVGITGEELFEKFDGTNFDELNEMLNQSQEPADIDNEEATETVPNETQQETVETEAEDNNTETSNSQENPVQEERKFTQKDVDYFLGKKTSKLQNKFTSLLDDLSVLLGVDKNNVVNTVRRQVMEREATEKGVEDTEAYVHQRELEEENETLKQQAYEREYFNAKIRNLRGQSEKLGVDFIKLSENEEFVNAVNMFYSNPKTMDKAIELAYHSIFFDELITQTAQSERDKVISTVKAGQNRMVEGARETTNGSSVKIDISKMNEDEIAKLAERVANGEKIVL